MCYLLISYHPCTHPPPPPHLLPCLSQISTILPHRICPLQQTLPLSLPCPVCLPPLQTPINPNVTPSSSTIPLQPTLPSLPDATREKAVPEPVEEGAGEMEYRVWIRTGAGPTLPGVREAVGDGVDSVDRTDRIQQQVPDAAAVLAAWNRRGITPPSRTQLHAPSLDSDESRLETLIAAALVTEPGASRSEHPEYRCGVMGCGAVYRYRNSLRFHQRQNHQDELVCMDVECEEVEVFGDRQGLQVHRLVYHWEGWG